MSNKLKLLRTILFLFVGIAGGLILIRGWRVPASDFTSKLQIREQPNSPSELKQIFTLAKLEFESQLLDNETRCQGKVIGEVIPQRGDAKNLKQLLATYPMPKMWLVFYRNSKDCDPLGNKNSGIYPTVTVPLPKKVARLLRAFWATACAYFYYEIFDKGDLNTQRERFIALVNAHTDTANSIEYLTIRTPSGKRDISDVEARSLVWYLRDSAQNLISNLYRDNKAKTPVASMQATPSNNSFNRSAG